MNSRPPSNSNKQFFLRYASLGTQLLAALALAVFLGLQGDKWLHCSPLLACALPLLTLAVLFYKLVKDTARKDPPDKNQ